MQTFHHREIYTLFEELIHKPWGQHIWHPPIDIFEEEEVYRIKVDLPGVEEEKINVNVSDRILIIAGERPFQKDIENSRVQTCERPQGTFIRKVEFFEHLDEENIKKQFDNGVLTIIVKKTSK